MIAIGLLYLLFSIGIPRNGGRTVLRENKYKNPEISTVYVKRKRNKINETLWAWSFHFEQNDYGTFDRKNN